MALNFLLDTNVLSEPTRILPNANVVAQIYENGSHIAIAAVSWHEMLFGLSRMPKSQKQRTVEQFIFKVVQPEIPILPYDAAAAAWFAMERHRLTLMGRTPSYADGQIAAVAAVNRLTLVTRNTADFMAYEGLDVENWFIG